MDTTWAWRKPEMVWPCAGGRVTHLVLDEYQVGLEITADAWSLYLTCESAFEWRQGSEMTVIDPQTRQNIGRLVPALGRTADTLRLDDAGNLELCLADGLALRAFPADRYESWNLTGKGCLKGLLYVAASSGLMRWEPGDGTR